MAVLQTEEEKKSLFATAIIFTALLLVLFFIKLSQDIEAVELEGGGGGGDIAVNFGDSDVGMGDNFTSTQPVHSAPKPTPQTPVQASDILTSDNDDAPVVADIKKTVDKPVKAPDEVKPVVKPTPKPPTPSKSTQNALDDLLNGTDQSGDGNDKVGGNKGKAYGNPNDRGYNGGGGSGTGSGGGDGSGTGPGSGSGSGGGSGSGRGTGVGSYMLAGRKNLNKPQPEYVCNEQGTVAVKIWVDRSGNVVRAEAGDRGTTNSASCLATQAVIAAKKTKWQPNEAAAETQVGKIVYNFRLD
ncbi:MAG: energy transducer TonB [Flavobacterium sp.]|nr:MAG: energy transducer TonB [Flavobacterium sp.]